MRSYINRHQTPKTAMRSYINNIAAFTPGFIRASQVGSTVTVDPPVSGTDVDFLVQVRALDAQTFDAIRNAGFVIEGNYIGQEPNSDFYSARSIGGGPDNTNLILTTSSYFYDRFMLATAVAKELNLKEKKDRITLFGAILNDKYPEGYFLETVVF